MLVDPKVRENHIFLTLHPQPQKIRCHIGLNGKRSVGNCTASFAAIFGCVSPEYISHMMANPFHERWPPVPDIFHFEILS